MKKISIGLFTLVMAIGFAAFTTPKKAAKTFNYSYIYTGTTVAGEEVAANYTQGTSQSTCNDNVPDLVCIISTTYAPDMNDHPQFPSTPDVHNNANITIQHYKPQ